jgi:chromosome segregation ATPase
VYARGRQWDGCRRCAICRLPTLAQRLAMPSTTTALNAMDHQIIHDSFRAWREQEDSLDGQLADSLVALEAYQSHLDAWQRELAAQRQLLDRERGQLEQDRATASDYAARLEKVSAELNDARNQVASLSKTLLERTEELRQLDGRRAELTTQLELARAREREWTAKIEQHPDGQQSQWAEELKQLRELFERQMELADVAEVWDGEPAQPPEEESVPASPVLGSIVAQFGKLRQQRAQTQRIRKKTE